MKKGTKEKDLTEEMLNIFRNNRRDIPEKNLWGEVKQMKRGETFYTLRFTPNEKRLLTKPGGLICKFLDEAMRGTTLDIYIDIPEYDNRPENRRIIIIWWSRGNKVAYFLPHRYWIKTNKITEQNAIDDCLYSVRIKKNTPLVELITWNKKTPNQ